jgi:hypothetical protein
MATVQFKSKVSEDTPIKKNKTVSIQEVIGRYILGFLNWRRWWFGKSIDETVPDYEWWDRFRRGLIRGFHFSGLFGKAVTQILSSWVMGTGFTIRTATSSAVKDTYTEGLLQLFCAHHKARFLRMVEDLFALGDQYIIIHTDGSLEFPSPETVEIDFDVDSAHKPYRIRFIWTLQGVLITDEYTAFDRVLTYRKGEDVRQETFDNPFGEIPIVHFTNDRGTNEVFGRPMYEAAYELLARYDTLFEAATEGGELSGRPIPVFEGMENPRQTVAMNSSSGMDDEYLDNQGGLVRRVRMVFDRFSTLVIGKGGRFHFASPSSGFTSDIKAVLKLLFLLFLDFTRIPEGVWGNELSSARATLREQMETFFKYIDSLRTLLQGTIARPELSLSENSEGFMNVLRLWLVARGFIDPKIKMISFELVWPQLSLETSENVRAWTQWAYAQGFIRRSTALSQSELVEQPEIEIDLAQREREQQDEFLAALNDENDAAAEEAA